jgi:hypothetical protein
MKSSVLSLSLYLCACKAYTVFGEKIKLQCCLNNRKDFQRSFALYSLRNFDVHARWFINRNVGLVAGFAANAALLMTQPLAPISR